jgi:CubicO group peptidase (beta-lactamase class C family)
MRANYSIILLSLIFIVIITIVIAYDWSSADKVLDDGINNGAFPGCVALVADSTGVLYVKAKGTTMYNDKGTAPMTVDTVFDMASVTKVISTTSAIALLYQHGILSSLKTTVSSIFPEFAVNGKQNITVENCLLHNAGFKPDPVPNYNLKEFGCPESSKYQPALVYTCIDKIYEATMAQTLDYPVGTKYVYSDLSMITLMYVVGHYAESYHLVAETDLKPNCAAASTRNGKLTCYYEAFVRRYVYEDLGMDKSTFITNENEGKIDKQQIAPAWFDDQYRHELIRGFVSDENGYANGGICGHAGLFSTINDVYKFAAKLMFPHQDATTGKSSRSNYSFLSEETVRLFTTVKNTTQSSRALGWDTNWGKQPYPQEYHFCGTLSNETYTHTGFTGTQVCYYYYLLASLILTQYSL